MSSEEKKLYNQRRTEAFRKRRIEEEQLLATPIGQISGEALERAQQIVVRNARRAEAARLRYQRMSTDQRKIYNQKRYTPKRKSADQPGPSTSGNSKSFKVKNGDDFDALSSLERDVLKQTQKAKQSLMRQQISQPSQQYPQSTTATIVQVPTNVTFSSVPASNTTTIGAHLMQQQVPPQSTAQIQYY
jgi:hypothetical protein